MDCPIVNNGDPSVDAYERIAELEAKLERVREAVDEKNGCECEYHVCDDRPCRWCYEMSGRVCAIIDDDGKGK